MQDQDRQRDLAERLLETLVGSDHFCQGLRRLRFVRDQRVGVHPSHNVGISGEVLVLEAQHVRMRRDVAEPLEDGQGEVWRWNLERKALAQEASKLLLMVKSVQAGHDASGTVPQQKQWQS